MRSRQTRSKGRGEDKVGDTSIFQLLPPLSDAEYGELKADIAKRGVLVPVEYDEDENIIDGHHRVKACRELGITKWPRLVRRGLSEDEKKSIALVLNLARRHLTHKQKAPIWKHMRDFGMTLEAIAQADGAVSMMTIQRVLTNVKTDGPATIKGKDGKTYPAKKKRKPKTVYISEDTAEKAEKLPEKYKRYVLTGAVKYMEAARDTKVDHIKATSSLPDAKYRVIYADPPWKYDNTQPDYHSEQRDHYRVMSLEDISGMEVTELCEDNAVLFLWVTSPVLQDAFKVISSWGFKYKASFVWDKVKHNMGHYNSVRHEFLLVCVRGSCQPDVRKLFDSVVTSESTGHSEKPAVFYDIIETLYPHGKKLELFARKERDGWDSHGNEL